MKRIHTVTVLSVTLIVTVAAMLTLPAVHAMPANPTVVTIAQPDGHRLLVRRRGDERGSWWETVGGRSIAKADDGYWYYVQRYERKRPVLSGRKVRVNDVFDLNSTIYVDRPRLDDLPPFEDASLRKGAIAPDVLVILAEYGDTPATYTDTSQWADMISHHDPARKTIVDYYSQASYGAVDMQPAVETHGVNNDGVVGWLTLGATHPVPFPITGSADMSTQSYTIAVDAIAAADPFVDFASYDRDQSGYVDPSELAVIIVVAGHEAATTLSGVPGVWAHASPGSILFTSDTVITQSCEEVCEPVSANLTSKPGYTGPTEICRMECEDVVSDPIALIGVAEMGEIHDSNHQATLGIMVHELGHLVLGLPDLYDTDGSSAGIGAFGVMSAGAWGMDVTADTYAGESPVLPSAWSAFKLQWVDAHAWGPITASGHHSMPPVKPDIGIAHVGEEVGGFWQCFGNQYFLVQYRANIGYDRGLSFFFDPFVPGVSLFHIDESQNANSEDSHRLLDLEEANNIPVGTAILQSQYQNHLWYEGNYTAFDNNSTPNSRAHFSARDSGVAIEVQSPLTTALGEEAVSVRIDSQCDVPQFTISTGVALP